MAGSLAKPEAPPTPVSYHGFVSTAPSAPGDGFTVTVPDFDEQHVFQIRRWADRGGALPAEGDEVLVIVDDDSEPWVISWWPAGGAPANSSKGVMVHGSDPTAKRPGGHVSVEWIGDVEPLNAIDNDTWVIPA